MKINVHNRCGFKTYFYQNKSGDWYFISQCPQNESWRMSMRTNETYSMIDPPGGPMVCDWTHLNDYHNKLPKKEILEIRYDILERAWQLVTN